MTDRFTTTSRQSDLLAFITARITESGVAPSFDEMKDHLGVKSKSGVHRLVLALEERGAIMRLPAHARAIAFPPSDLVLSPGISEALRQRYGRPDRIEAYIRHALIDDAPEAHP